MIDSEAAWKVISLSQGKGAQFSEIFYENTYYTTFKIGDSEIRNFTAGKEEGVGIRIIADDCVGYSFTQELSYKRLQKITEECCRMARSGDTQCYPTPMRLRRKGPTIIPKDATDSPSEAKFRILTGIDHAARDFSPFVQQVIGQYTDFVQKIMIFNSEGLLVEDIRSSTSIKLTLIASRGKRKEVVVGGFGWQGDLTIFAQERLREIGRQLALDAVERLDARPAPHGRLPVIIAGGQQGGIFIHEVIGHMLEADLVTSGSSLYGNKLNTQSASPLVTIIDDATIPNRKGSFNFDDEGTVAQKTSLINEGILRNYLTDRLTAKKLNLPTTGNARRESYQYPPISRMTCTYLKPGVTSRQSLIAEVKKGLYVTQLGGGRVDPISGLFSLNIFSAHLIENGRVTDAVRDCVLTGYITEALHGIRGVGNDFAFDQGIDGGCEKRNQMVPVSFGMPTILIESLLITGQESD